MPPPTSEVSYFPSPLGLRSSSLSTVLHTYVKQSWPLQSPDDERPPSVHRISRGAVGSVLLYSQKSFEPKTRTSLLQRGVAERPAFAAFPSYVTFTSQTSESSSATRPVEKEEGKEKKYQDTKGKRRSWRKKFLGDFSNLNF